MAEELSFLVDENIPFRVVRELRRAGHKVATVDQIARPGINNDELASLSIKHGMIIITRDVDFTRLKRDLMRKIKAIYVKLRMEPDKMAEYILNNLISCIENCQQLR